MKRNNFRILWYIIAVALFLVAIAGLNLKLQGDHAKENKTTQSATNTKLNIALVNEDQNVSNGKESYNLGASYIKSIERDNSQNWSVVSRGTAQNGLNKGDYQLMVIIPNNFSQKLLDVNKANAEQTTISYKVNAKGNLALEKKATEKGKDIVSELNSHLVNMYMASILSNLYTAQENVQAMVNVQSGNISNYQKNLLDSATNFQNIFPALVNQSSSSITANESLKKSLEASDNMFNDLVTTQTNTGKDLSSLIEQRHQDSISYEAFSASLLEMNNELLEKQLSDIITQAQKDQETLSSQLNSIMGDDNDNDHNHKENSSAYLNVARQKIQELSEALKSQDNVAKDQSEQLDKIVREGLASYFAKNNKDNITLLELLKSHSNNEKTLKDFKAKVADFTNSLISSIPSLNLSELHLTQEEEKAIQFTSSDSEIIKKVSNERTLYLNTNLLNRLFEARKNRDEAKNKVNQLKLPSSSTRTGEQIVSVESNNPDYRVDTWTVNGKQTRTLDPSQNNNIIINSSYQGESSNSSITKPSYTITIGNQKQIVQNDDGKTQRSYLETEATYQRTLQEVIDAYNTTHNLVSKYYIFSDGEEPQSLFDQFLNQSVNDTMVDLVKNGITKYLMDENTADAQQKVKDVMEEVENRQTPAEALRDGYDFVPMPKWKNGMIELLNIAGTGPIFGPILGALYGPVAYIWIVLGCIFAGAVHDYMIGMISLRNNGAYLPELASRYLGKSMKHVINIFSMLLLILVATVFVVTPANLILSILPAGTLSLPWIIGLIFVYYLISTVLPIDKALGKVYPVFCVILMVSTAAVGFRLLTGGFDMPNLTFETFKNMHPAGLGIFPALFFTISCGAISGFHATQAPMVSRTTVNEREGRFTFYGMMIAEGVIAMIWAGASMSLFKGQNLYEMIAAGTPSAVVNQVMLMLLGSVIGTIAIIGVIVLPVSSGLSAFRSLRTIVADYIHVKQDTLPKIFAVTIPLYVISFVLTHVDFNLLWRYFNWANQVTAVIGLLVATRYLILKRRNYWVTFVPAMFMLYAVVVYILSQPIGFNMGLGILTYSLALVLTGILVGLFWKSGQKQLKTVHPEAFLFNDHRPINYYSSLDS